MNKFSQQILEVIEEPLQAMPLSDDVVIYDQKPSIEQVKQVHETLHDGEVAIEVTPDVVVESEEPDDVIEIEIDEAHPINIEVNNPTIEIVIEDLPGAPENTPDPIVVEDVKEEENKEDENSAKDKNPWDWCGDDSERFVSWTKEKLSKIPKHSGYDIAGLERAYSYMEKLKGSVRKCMRNDIDGLLDADMVSELLEKIDNGLERLNSRIEKVEKSKKQKKKAGFAVPIVKQASSHALIKQIVVTVPLLIYRLALACLNSITAGHDIVVTFEELSDKFKLNDRERIELEELLNHLGYPMPMKDRGFRPNEERDLSEHGVESIPYYKG